MTSSAAPLKPRPEPNRVPGSARGQPQTHRAPCVSVLIVDDSLTVRTALKRMVESDPMLIVTGTASSAETALAQIRQSAPDVVLLDLEMPGMGGLKALPAILELAPHSAVLVVSALTEEGAQATLAALAMGAADTMLKPRPGEFTEDLFTDSQPQKADRAMEVLDEINDRWGRGTLRAASVPVDPAWAMRRELMSRSYTTRLDGLWVVRCH